MPPLRLQIGRFGVIGGAASVTHVVVGLWTVTKLGISPLIANMLAFSLAVVVSYVGNHGWTFERIGRHDRHFPRFLIVSLIGFALNQLIVYGTVNICGLDYILGLAIVVLVIPTLSFLMSRYWAFVDFSPPTSSATGRHDAA